MRKQRLVSQAEYAEHRGVTQQRVNRMIHEKRIPTAHGRIDIVKADAILAAECDAEGISLADALRRKESALASLRELELSRKAGQVVEVEAVTNLMARDYLNVKTGLLALPTKLIQAMSLNAADKRTVFSVSTRVVREALWGLHQIVQADEYELCPKCTNALQKVAGKVELPPEAFPKEAR